MQYYTAEDVNFYPDSRDTALLLKCDAPGETSNIHSPLPMVQTSSEDYTDVLIVGAGPAGLMMAMTLARMGIKPSVIDAAGYDSHQYGRADALQPRSMEVMQSFGTPLDQLIAMGKKIFGRAFWEISGASTRRTALARFFPPFLDFEKDYALAVRQGLIEQVMIYDIERHCEGFEVHWNCEFLDIELSTTTSGSSTVLVRETQTGRTRKLTAKYVVAADGGRSSVRRWASPYGIKLEGECLPVTWCVLDAVNLRSNYPDLERLSVLRSSKGIVLVIPREPIDGKPSARFDIQLANSKQEATREEAAQMIKDIFHPYEIDWDEINWWSAYEAGLGLNTALLEAHNLAWKMGLVLKGVAVTQILSTYGLERHGVAKELIQMDRRLVEIYAGLEKQSIDDFTDASGWLSTLHTFQASHYAYQAGASIVYPRTPLTASRKRLAVKVGKPGVIPGARTRPAIVTRLSDFVPVPVVSRFDGRFTLYFLVGDLSKNNGLERLVNLDTFLRRPRSIFSRFGSNLVDKPNAHRLSSIATNSIPDRALPQGRVLYSYIYDDIPQTTKRYHGASHSIFHTSVITTLSTTNTFVEENITKLIYPGSQPCPHQASPIFRPQHFFSDDIPLVSPYRQTAPEAGAIFEHPMHNKWGVDPDVGSIVVVRPDGHVALKTVGFGIEEWEEVESYFEGFLIPHKSERTSVKRKGIGYQ
ncbi:hypothetical protein C0995_010627 [Termitomyces sp. Mi166|nr:hypothetical protein C0995_010627 [Termitomyces sp. Mi166\